MSKYLLWQYIFMVVLYSIMSLGAKQQQLKCQKVLNKPIWLTEKGQRSAGPKRCDTCSLATIQFWGKTAKNVKQGSVVSAEVMKEKAVTFE